MSYLSHCLRVQLAMIHKETMNTRRTVPGQMVMRVFRTKRVLKLIRFNAPILREDASVNSLECSSITLKRAHKNKYKTKGILCATCHYCLKAYVIRHKRFAIRIKAKGCFIFIWGHLVLFRLFIWGPLDILKFLYSSKTLKKIGNDLP